MCIIQKDVLLAGGVAADVLCICWLLQVQCPRSAVKPREPHPPPDTATYQPACAAAAGTMGACGAACHTQHTISGAGTCDAGEGTEPAGAAC